MQQRPEPPPEGRLIAEAAARMMSLSIREAARRAGISYGRWRQISAGYQNVSPGEFAAVRAPAATLARMARVVGVTADQMETEGRRPDVAELLRQEPPAQVVPFPSLPPVAETDAHYLELPDGVTEEDVEPLIADIGRRVARLLMEVRPGETVPGERVFPDSPRDSWLWNTLMDGNYPPAAATRFVAAVQAEAAKGLRRGQGSG